jgi:acyl carrier protein
VSTELKGTVLEVIAKVSKKEIGEIQPEMDLVVDLGIDSPKALELLVELEDRLDVEISDEDAATLDSVEDVLQCAAKLKGLNP